MLPLTPCSYTGNIPEELAGGQYVRNGGNPMTNEDLGRTAHWFDGDGMLSGVVFKKSGDNKDKIQTEFVNQYILTDIYLSTLGMPSLKAPILPSVATLLNPASTLLLIILRILRTVFIAVLSRLPGSTHIIQRISVANTALVYHDGRALATCESGPPMRVALPSLETIGWFNGREAEGEQQEYNDQPVLGGGGFLHFMKEWTTGHPKVDPDTKEMILYQCTFMKPYVRYSVIPAAGSASTLHSSENTLMNAPVCGMSSPKMMHDFGVSRNYSVIMDLPLALDPHNMMRGLPVVSFDPTKPARFGVFPRWQPLEIRWFETSACCIFHTANTWDTIDPDTQEATVHMLACRQTSAAVIFSVGNIAEPEVYKNAVVAAEDRFTPRWWKKDRITHRYSDESKTPTYEKGPELESPYSDDVSSSQGSSPISAELAEEPDRNQCRLYYYCFSLSSDDQNCIRHQWALSAVEFEFPALHPCLEMKDAQYIYGCSTSMGSLTAALGRATKVDVLVKYDVRSLIARGNSNPPTKISGCVDSRSVADFKANPSTDPSDPIKLFFLPDGWYGQEPRFVPRRPSTERPEHTLTEDDGYLLFYVFDESQMDSDGECLPEAGSELWILDAKNFTDVVAKVKLPQRVPYGLHGKWFPEAEILAQRPFSDVRHLPVMQNVGEERNAVKKAWLNFRSKLIASLQ